MIEFDDVQDLVSPVVIAAFEGWNDAADAASGAGRPPDRGVEGRGRSAPSTRRSSTTSRSTGRSSAPTTTAYRRLTWPTTRIAVAAPAELDRDVILVARHRAQHAWRQFCAELLAACDDLGAELVVTLGALLADTPHTRPIPVTGTASEPELVDRLALEQSTLRGSDRHRRRLPGRVHPARHPGRVLLGRGPPLRRPAALPQGDARPARPARGAARGPDRPSATSPEDARAWERGVDELAAEDEDVADYVRALEETRDTADLPEATGEAIAREFERYLKRRDDED